MECTESLDGIAAQHPILRAGVTVAIGLDKITKLYAVFARYVEFCNEHCGTMAQAYQKIEMTDLEFVHCQLLKADDTAETSALMKNDRIRVRRNRDDERIAEAELNRIQRESDREYFKRMRQLLPDTGGKWVCDLVLDCRGKLVDESGRSQEVLRSTVRAHSVILAVRCKWLGHCIQLARDEQARRSIVTIPEQNEEDNNNDDSPGLDSISIAARSIHYHHKNNTNRGNNVPVERNVASVVAIKSRSDDASLEDDEIGVLHLPMGRNIQQPVQILDRGGAAEIENDEEDDDDDDHDASYQLITPRNQSGVIQDLEDGPVASPILSSASSGMGNELWVTIPNHSPHAIRLLLEFCYTNRVVSLGQEAFLQASRSKTDTKHKGPVPPYPNTSSGSRRWPHNGLPQVSFGVALAGIVVAEEAGLPRLSLMCEVAASQLVSNVHHVVEALCLCTTQQQRSANALSRLRKAAMDFVLRGGAKGVADLARTPSFRRALEEKSASLVPSLLSGTTEAVITYGKRKRENYIAATINTPATMPTISDATTNYFHRYVVKNATWKIYLRYMK